MEGCTNIEVFFNTENFLNEIVSILVSEILKSIEPLKGKIRHLLQIFYAHGWFF